MTKLCHIDIHSHGEVQEERLRIEWAKTAEMKADINGLVKNPAGASST